MAAPYAGSGVGFSAVVSNGLAQTFNSSYSGADSNTIPASRPLVARVPSQTGSGVYSTAPASSPVARMSTQSGTHATQQGAESGSALSGFPSLAVTPLSHSALVMRRASIGPTHIVSAANPTNAGLGLAPAKSILGQAQVGSITSAPAVSGLGLDAARHGTGSSRVNRAANGAASPSPSSTSNSTSPTAFPRYAAPTHASTQREQRAQNPYAASVQTTAAPLHSILMSGSAPVAARRASLSATLPNRAFTPTTSGSPGPVAVSLSQSTSNNQRQVTSRRESLSGLPLASTFAATTNLHIRPSTASIASSSGLNSAIVTQRIGTAAKQQARQPQTIDEDSSIDELVIKPTPRGSIPASALALRPGTAPAPFALNAGVGLHRSSAAAATIDPKKAVSALPVSQPEASPSAPESMKASLPARDEATSNPPSARPSTTRAYKYPGPHPRPTAASLALAARFTHNRASVSQSGSRAVPAVTSAQTATSTTESVNSMTAKLIQPANVRDGDDFEELVAAKGEAVTITPVDHGFGTKQSVAGEELEEDDEDDDNDRAEPVEKPNSSQPRSSLTKTSSTTPGTSTSSTPAAVPVSGSNPSTSQDTKQAPLAVLTSRLQSQLTFTPRPPAIANAVRPSTTSVGTRSWSTQSSQHATPQTLLRGTMSQASTSGQSTAQNRRASVDASSFQSSNVGSLSQGPTSTPRPQTSHGTSSSSSQSVVFGPEAPISIGSPAPSAPESSESKPSAKTWPEPEKIDLSKVSGINAYVLGEPLGEGTFGKVRKGRHVITGMTVAIKVLEKQRMRTREDLERVEREIDLLHRVDHADVIRLYEVIRTQNVIYLVMEFCNAGSLFDHIVKRGRLTERESCRVFHHILNGVAHCHSVSVCHRDLKPENLLLTDDGRSIKLVDFGLGNIIGPNELLTTACGSPCYAAPEMLAGRSYKGTQSDMWSLGVVLYALVCGYLPFDDPNTARLYDKIRSGSYTIPSHLSRGAADLIRSLLVTDPNRRFTPALVRKHPWYCGLSVSTDPFFTPPTPTTVNGKGIPVIDQPLVRVQDLDVRILYHMHRMGIDADQTLRCIMARKRNLLTTTYLLFAEKKRVGKLDLPPLPESLMLLPPTLISLKLGYNPSDPKFLAAAAAALAAAQGDKSSAAAAVASATATADPANNSSPSPAASTTSATPLLADTMRAKAAPSANDRVAAILARRGSDPGIYQQHAARSSALGVSATASPNHARMGTKPVDENKQASTRLPVNPSDDNDDDIDVELEPTTDEELTDAGASLPAQHETNHQNGQRLSEAYSNRDGDESDDGDHAEDDDEDGNRRLPIVINRGIGRN